MKNFKIALQLYSVRDAIKEDMSGALKKIKEMGYDYVEFAGYGGRTAEEVRSIIDDIGLKSVSAHHKINYFEENGQEAVDYIKTIGAPYVAIPSYPLDQFTGEWETAVERFTNTGKLLHDNGIQMLYHNHDFEFNRVDGEFILDRLYAAVPKAYLAPQVDTCWVHYAGCNPAEYLLKYTGRIKVVHLKDFTCTRLGAGPVYALIGNDGSVEKKASREDNGFEYRPLGQGIQNIPEILEASEKAGAEVLIVEQDDSFDRPPMEAARVSREYLRTLGL